MSIIINDKTNNSNSKSYTVNQIRDKFLQYFVTKRHTVVKSSSLIPHDDKTLLFTNAGMNQFKNVFLGQDTRDYVRATSAQKCVRAGGKHNDLENVGYTARHHTFFEMLGNFSFGDYFKEDAIKYAWEFLTGVLGIPKDKLYVTVYHTDDAAYDIWHNQIGLTPDRIIRIGDKPDGGSDNFWQMGETGPCGPCTEIFYDHGAEIPGGLPGSVNEDGDRYIEIWNCVFMQFNRDDAHNLYPLPKPSVDTGMGLERISAVMQNVHSNYEIDLFKNLIKSAAEITKCTDINSASLKVLADHIRSITFLIADGVMPSNEGRGYVLRRIIRRAIRHGYKLNCRRPFLYRLVNELIHQMGDAYNELIVYKEHIENTILQEEERFFETIITGMQILKSELDKLGLDGTTNHQLKQFDGNIAFKLYDTYGFPLDLTADICREVGISVDIPAFEAAMQQQQATSKQSNKFKMANVFELNETDSELCKAYDTTFVGYNEPSITARIVAIYKENETTTSKTLKSGESGVVVLDQTVFYPEGGGQIGDVGVIQIDGGANGLFSITDTQKIRVKTIGHIGKVERGELNIGDEVTATYDLHKRLATARNHSVTHLLHKALHVVVGSSALQKGSLVCSENARFDFAHQMPLTIAQITEIERMVNHVIMMNYSVTVTNMNYEDAIKAGALALFGEKYTEKVRVIKMGDFSTELCGGTHVKRTGDIGFFKIISETGVSSGVRRIEAITGEAAINYVQQNSQVLSVLSATLKAQTANIVVDKVNNLLAEKQQLVKQINQLNAKLAAVNASKLLDKVVIIHDNIRLLVLEQDNLDNKALLELVVKLQDKLVSGIIVIGNKQNNKADLVVAVTPDLISKYQAPIILNHLTTKLGGRGGGRPDLARGSATDVAQLASVLNGVQDFMEIL